MWRHPVDHKEDEHLEAGGQDLEMCNRYLGSLEATMDFDVLIGTIGSHMSLLLGEWHLGTSFTSA